MRRSSDTSASVHAFPMHGHHKLINEGFRTRDGHIIEWLSSLLRPTGRTLRVHSRPEPWLLAPKQRLRSTPSLPDNLHFNSPRTVRPPRSRDRQRWWVESLRDYPPLPLDGTPVVVWNPLAALSSAGSSLSADGRRLHVDLLDNWLDHSAFDSISTEVHAGYERLFDVAASVSANSEHTLELARSFGRSDARLILNGCDPERFDARSGATGPTAIGYLGKIGFRLDLPGILKTIDSLPNMDFWFAGPILDAEYRAPLASRDNVRLLGDVHYSDVPNLLTNFDIGWVPHGVGSGKEVGGDVIKIYEYRAAGLPVVTTPVIGAGERGLSHVTVGPIATHARLLQEMVAGKERVPRALEQIPTSMTWQDKAKEIATCLLIEP